MPWLPADEAARALGVALRTLRDWGTASPPRIQRKPHTGRTFLYLVGDDDEEITVETPRPDFPVSRNEKSEDEAGEWHDYYFDKERDKYVFSLRSKGGRAFAIAGDTIRAAIAAYSRDGSDATINEVSRVNGWNRRTTIEILKALGKTHDSAPFTDEEIGARGEDELADDLLRRKEERIIRRAERADWERTKKLADEARHLDRFLLRRVEEIIAAGNWAPPSQAPSIHLERRPTDTECTAVFGLTDAHVGAHAWAKETGHENNIEIVRERTLAVTKRLIERVASIRIPSRWVLPSGSDNIHADNYDRKTTRGTVLDTDGSHAKMYLAACSLYEEVIALLLAVAPVEVVAMPGNHDRNTTVMLTHHIATRFRDEQFVKVGCEMEERAYRIYGKALVCFTHGDKIKDQKIPLVMAKEAQQAWGLSTSQTVFSGHWHTDMVNEFCGVRVIRMPTLALNDRWHQSEGYISNTKAISAYLIDHEEGLVASLPVQPPPSKP
jgi:hypothetical protein